MAFTKLSRAEAHGKMAEPVQMKIAALTGISRTAGGLYYACSSLYKELQALPENIGIRVYGAACPHADRDRGAWEKVPVETYRTCGPLQMPAGLRDRLEEFGAPLVHLHGIWLGSQWVAEQWRRRTGGRVIISPHGMLDPWALKNAVWKKKLVSALFADRSFANAACIHALCRSEVESIRAYGLDNPVAVIPNGINLPEISSAPRTWANAKSLLFLGRIHPKKGLKELLHAWVGAPEEWRLIIAGWDDGGFEQGLKVLAKELGLSGSVEFVGPKHGEEKDRLLRAADAFVLPSFSEGLPMSVLEAWSYQLPVLMTAFCNLPEGFSSRAAVEVEPYAESIKAGLNELAGLSDEDLMTMGRRGRRLVEQKFAWPGIAASMQQVYKWCIEGGSPPECVEL